MGGSMAVVVVVVVVDGMMCFWWNGVLLVEWCVAWMDWLFYDLVGRIVWMDFPLKIMHAAWLSRCMATEGWEDFDR